jgi:hypothetical protein
VHCVNANGRSLLTWTANYLTRKTRQGCVATVDKSCKYLTKWQRGRLATSGGNTVSSLNGIDYSPPHIDNTLVFPSLLTMASEQNVWDNDRHFIRTDLTLSYHSRHWLYIVTVSRSSLCTTTMHKYRYAVAGWLVSVCRISEHTYIPNFCLCKNLCTYIHVAAVARAREIKARYIKETWREVRLDSFS